MTDAVRAQAAERPGAWVYAIDPHFDPAGKVPPYGVVGAWKVDPHGRVTGEFKRNPNYRPSPRARGLKDPTDPVDAAIQLAATQYASDAEVRSTLLDSVVYLIPGVDTVAESTSGGMGRPTIAIYTSPAHAPSSVPEIQCESFRKLLLKLPEHAVLKLNPGSSASVEIPVSDMRRATRP